MTDIAQPANGPAVATAGSRNDDNKRRRRTLAPLALGLAALAVAVGSGADFSAQTANPSNTFSAGSLSMDNSKNGAAIFSATNLKPGGTEQTGIVDIKNTGSIDGVFTVTRDQLTSSDSGQANPAPFASKVIQTIVDCGKFTTVNTAYGPDPVTPSCGDGDDEIKYVGSLASQNTPIQLGTFQPDEKHRYRFGANLDMSTGNEYQGDGSTARYVFDAVQTH